MLTGQAKTDYQRGYMRRRRASQGLDGAESASKGRTAITSKPQDAPQSTISVRPDMLDLCKSSVRPPMAKALDLMAADVKESTSQTLREVRAGNYDAPVQHHSPMMVGYEPPR